MALVFSRSVLHEVLPVALIQKCRHGIARALLARQHFMQTEQENTNAMPVGGE
jgi:hypothetical protein